MFVLLGTIAGLVCTVILCNRCLYSSSLRKITILFAVICIIFNIYHDGNIIKFMDNYSLDNAPFFLLFIECFLESFLFTFCFGGTFLGFIELLIHIQKKYPKASEPISNNSKWTLTIIFMIIALICCFTGILMPVAFGCAALIKQLWKN